MNVLLFRFRAVQLVLLALTFLPPALFAQHIQSFSRKNAASQQVFLNPLQAPFYHGVASGDPLPNAVIIWTRVTPDDSLSTSIPVTWEIAGDLGFTNIIQSGTSNALDSRDYTVKLDIAGLQANTYYYYRFGALGKESVIGRTKTAPDGDRDRIRMAFVSCSDYRQGYFTAMKKLADRNDLDAVVHLGDYIYEAGGGPPEREHDPNFEIYRLQDYRARLSQYRLDSNLQRCHQVHPWINIWDDHDIVVDALTDTSYRHNASIHGLYRDRKQAAVQAFREWLPVRDPIPLQDDFFKNWRHLPYGNLLDLYLLDVRLYDRDRFADDVNDSIYGDPDAKILGPDQLAWINGELAQSQARWKVLGNQLQISQFVVGNVPLVFENWDGYPVERQNFFDNIINNGVDNVVFCTGDFHVSFANDLTPNPFNVFQYNPLTGEGAIGVEFIVPSVTGDNFDEGNDFGLGSAALASGLIQSGNWHTKFVELEGHGYVLLDLDSSRAQAEFWHMSDITDPANFTENLAAIWQAVDQENHLSQGSAASSPISGIPLPPPAPVFVGLNESMASSGAILGLYPNPTERHLYLNYALNRKSRTEISILDINGKLLQKSFSDTQTPGNYLFELDVQDFPGGIYLLKISYGGNSFTRKFIRY